MLRVEGHPKRLCDGLTRRDLLVIGGAGLLAGAAATKATASSPLPGFGRAKSCILLFLYGSPSQLETFDPKPEAPEGIRGTLGGAIASKVPGVNVAEGLPHIAQALDRMTILRAVTHPYPIHGVAYALTGVPRIDVSMELAPRDAGHYPALGSMVAYHDRNLPPGPIPPDLLLPWAFSSRRVGEVPRAGPYAGLLGPSWDPIALEFRGEGTVKARKTLTTQVWEQHELYRGVDPAGRFGLPGAEPGKGVTLDALDRRRNLLDQIESARRAEDADPLEPHRAAAFRLLQDPRLRRAFDLGEERPNVRESYGMTLFGQSALTARRLVEAGARFVSVFWDEYGLAGSGWDTHWDHFERMSNELLPGLDRALAGLLLDLDCRGLLDETLVLVLSEHGRTPQLTLGQGGGRDHWSRCYSVALAGGPIARGRVVGRSDKIGGDAIDGRVSPKDVLATALHALGVPPDLAATDRQGRPVPLLPEGRVIAEALA